MAPQADPHELNARLIVFAHAFHADIWAEMARGLAEAMDRPFALCLTCPIPEMALALPETPHLTAWSRLTTENRGRDVLPFLKALQATHDSFEFGLKLHTKKSVHRADGPAWRQFILSSLLKKDEDGLVALDLMERAPSIGLIAPDHHLMPLANRLVLNRRNLNAIMAKTKTAIPLAALAEGSFAAGTMFWFRRQAIAAFAETDLDPLFGPERADLDGTPAHAAERLFVHMAEQRGYLATAGEAIDAIRAAFETDRGSDITKPVDLAQVNRLALRPQDNRFILGFRPFWLRHPRLFEAYATVRHLTYERIAERLKSRP